MWVLIIVIAVILIAVIVKAQNTQKKNEDARLLNNLLNSSAPTQSDKVRYTYDIVGEQSYQKNLAKIAGKKEEESKFHECYAVVSSEPFNKFDKNAVKVEINGLLVGYVNKVDASKLAGKVINKTVPAVVNGGWDDGDTKGSYGVKLAINNVYDLA